MAGTAEGALKTAASRTGLSVSEYIDRVNAGLRWCWRDQDWEKASEFGVDKSRADGLTRSCKRSISAAARRSYKTRVRPAAGRWYVDARAEDKQQARRRVNHLVDMKILPRPNDLPCTDCGHKYQPGGKRHEYDHHKGYAPEHHEEVEPVCTTCHHDRERKRSGL